MVHKYLIFSPREITHLPGYINPSLLTKSITAFELITAVMWRCRTIALDYKVNTKVRLIFTINARGRWKSALPIPHGYYRNALVYTIVETTVGDLCGSPLVRTIELIHKAKADMSLERMRSTLDMMALLRGRPTLPTQHVYWVSDIGHIGDDTVDFGWAEWVGGGMPVPKLSSFHTRCKDRHGEESITVSMLLPGSVMDKFANEIASWLNKDNGDLLMF
uniref:Uncharacterized protein n=1 Tax=Hordeum vulgare subsp. vulgare TaxID=112509 RepID=A0A8I6YJD4_HORVV